MGRSCERDNTVSEGGGRKANIVFFFFQAEDGIRDVAVTGVQTCALPIFLAISMMSRKATAAARGHHARYEYLFVRADGEQLREITRLVESGAIKPLIDKIGRASCRERV